jgi:hypothetical protein
VYEAACFVRVLELQPDALAPDEELVRKWLPGVVAFHDAQRDAAILRCHAAAPEVTEAVVLGELRRRLRSDPGGTYLIESLPEKLWSATFAAAAADLVQDRGYAAEGRRTILRSLNVHAPELARPILLEWLQSAMAVERTAAIDILLCVDPAVAWPAMKNEVQLRGKEAFFELRSLRSRNRDVVVDLGSWPSGLLEDVYRTLMETFPPSEDPKRVTGVAYGVTPDDEYRDLRKGLPNVLLTRGTIEDNTALDRLSAEFPTLRLWLLARRADQQAGAVLAEFGTGGRPEGGGTVPWQNAARAIEGGVYRLLRTPADLQAVLVEELDRMRLDGKEHLSLLYHPRKGRKPKGEPAAHKTLQEDALQAYFYCRLSDRLAGRVLDPGTQVIFHRETLATKDQRLDIKVQAPMIGGGIATIVIELKWSDNPGVSTSLRKQLVEEYLGGLGLTHGIYLVGWSVPGRWKDKTTKGPSDPKSRNAWLSCLEAQAGGVAKQLPGMCVVPLLFDLEWPQSKRVKKAVRTHHRKGEHPPKKRIRSGKPRRVKAAGGGSQTVARKR